MLTDMKEQMKEQAQFDREEATFDCKSVAYEQEALKQLND